MAPESQTEPVAPNDNQSVPKGLVVTQRGIMDSRPHVTREHMEEYHGGPCFESEETVVFADSRGYEWDEYLNTFADMGLSTAEVSDRLYEVAEDTSPADLNRWEGSYPIPIDKRSGGFGEE